MDTDIFLTSLASITIDDNTSTCGWNHQSKDCLIPKTSVDPGNGLLAPPRRRYSDSSSHSSVSFGLSSTTINSREASLLDHGAIDAHLSPSRFGRGHFLPNIDAALAGDHSTSTSIPSPLTYSEVVAINEPQFPPNAWHSGIISMPISQDSFQRLPSPAIPHNLPVLLDEPTGWSEKPVVLVKNPPMHDQPEGSDKKTSRWRRFFKHFKWFALGKKPTRKSPYNLSPYSSGLELPRDTFEEYRFKT